MTATEVAASQGRKDDSGKLRYDLIPTYPLGLVADVYTRGAKKYDDRNWEKGIEWSRIYAAIQRHLNAYWAGETRDPEGQHHLASVVWGCMALMEYENTHPELDDRPRRFGPGPVASLLNLQFAMEELRKRKAALRAVTGAEEVPQGPSPYDAGAIKAHQHRRCCE